MGIAGRIHHLVSLMEKSADHFLEEGQHITFMQLMILHILCCHPKLPQKALALKMNVTAGAISRQIEILRAKGLLTRVEKEANRREHSIAITQEGTDAVRNAFIEVERQLSSIFGDLDDSDKNSMSQMLDKVIKKIDPAYEFEAKMP
jgi:DNA-binding MarR family transcriptional regulator